MNLSAFFIHGIRNGESDENSLCDCLNYKKHYAKKLQLNYLSNVQLWNELVYITQINRVFCEKTAL